MRRESELNLWVGTFYLSLCIWWWWWWLWLWCSCKDLSTGSDYAIETANNQQAEEKKANGSSCQAGCSLVSQARSCGWDLTPCIDTGGLNGDDKGDEWEGKTPRAYRPAPAPNKTCNCRFRLAASWATNELAGYKTQRGCTSRCTLSPHIYDDHKLSF